ncbi:MAG: FesM, partial [Anaerolineae bacterium]
IAFAFAALSNAFGMVPPFYDLMTWLAVSTGIRSEIVLLALVFGVLNLALPAAAGLSAATISRALAGKPEPLRVTFSRFAPAFIPLAVALWLAHYAFHFLTGALAIIPVLQTFLLDHGILQTFLLDHGIAILGAEPNWRLGGIIPGDWILPLQTVMVLAGFAGSLYVGNRVGRRDLASRPVAARALLPWLILFAGMAVAGLATFNLPMEMRGTMLMGG